MNSNKGNEEIVERNKTIYEALFKRIFDVVISLIIIITFFWLYIVISIIVKIKIGSPIIFKQMRPGLNEIIFPLYKFRTMTNDKDDKGELLPDELRLTDFGKWLRSTSLDELPEIFNILNGTMSLIGPRPQLVRDMVFMSTEQRRRHVVRPGLSGLAQINGRNLIKWEEKFKYDLKYIEKITFLGDLKILFMTIIKAFIVREGVSDGVLDTSEDYGDYLLREGKVNREKYEQNQIKAKEILENRFNVTK